MEQFTLFYKNLKNKNLLDIIEYVTTHEYNNLYCSIEKYKLCFTMFFSIIKEIPDNLIFFGEFINVNYSLHNIHINILDYDYDFIDKYLSNYALPLLLKPINKKYKLTFIGCHKLYYSIYGEGVPSNWYDNNKTFLSTDKFTFLLTKYPKIIPNYMINDWISIFGIEKYIDIIIKNNYILDSKFILKKSLIYIFRESRNDFYDYLENTTPNNIFIDIIKNIYWIQITNIDLFDKLTTKYSTYLRKENLLYFLYTKNYDINLLHKYYIFGFIYSNLPSRCPVFGTKGFFVDQLLNLLNKDLEKYKEQLDFIHSLNLQKD